MTTKNYGLKGGELDATNHLAVAVPKLLTEFERVHWSKAAATAAATQTARQQASNN